MSKGPENLGLFLQDFGFHLACHHPGGPLQELICSLPNIGIKQEILLPLLQLGTHASPHTELKFCRFLYSSIPKSRS